MQNKKVTMLAAVLAVTVIAMAGVGYAIAGYTATTTNTDNEITTTHIVISQKETETAAYDGNFLTSLGFNTDTEKVGGAVKTTYVPKLDEKGAYDFTNHTYAANATEGKNVATISSALTLTVTPTNPGENAKGNLVVTAKTSAGAAVTLNSEMHFVMLLTNNGETKVAENDGNTWNFTNLDVTATKEYTVTLLVAFNLDQGNVVPLNSADTGFHKLDTTTGNGDSFTFVLTTTA